MQAEPQHVQWWPQQRRIGEREQRGDRRIVGYQRPVAIDRNRRIGLVALEHEIDRLAGGLHGRIGEGALRKYRRITCRNEQHVSLAQRDFELLGELQHHVARGLRTTGFEKAQMLCRNLGFKREVELAQATALSPRAQMIADREDGCHGAKIAQATTCLHYLRVNRPRESPRLIDGSSAAKEARRFNERSSIMLRQITNLRFALLGDAIASGATGLMMIAGADLLTGLLGLPVDLMRGAGLLLIPYVAFVAFVSTRRNIPHEGVKAIIALNIIWVVGSVVLLLSGFVAPTVPGYAFVVFQAIVVGVFAELQFVALRREIAAA